jgi:hypothetical protein
MDLKAIFGGISVGKDNSGNIKPSIKGLAVKVAEGNFVAREGDKLVDVGGFVFDGGEKFIIRLPVTAEQVVPGDLLVLADEPFQALFVTEISAALIAGLNPQTSTRLEYVPRSNMFGLNLLVKVVSLLENFGAGSAIDLLPLLLMGDGGLGGDDDSGLSTLLLLQSLGGGAPSTDLTKLLPLLLLKGGKGDGLESLLMLQALGLNLGNLGAPALQSSKGPVGDLSQETKKAPGGRPERGGAAEKP